VSRLTDSDRIRSFEPKKPAVIRIYSPLTLIVGPNGSGKTVR
jgi:DNA repair exonuclease SbcCD ATPase subunit